jgi:hypothetical protein
MSKTLMDAPIKRNRGLSVPIARHGTICHHVHPGTFGHSGAATMHETCQNGASPLPNAATMPKMP